MNVNSTVFQHFMCNNSKICINEAIGFSLFYHVLLILHFVPRILFMIILDFAKVWDYDLNYDFVCLSSSPHLGFFVQGTSTMFENEMIIIESVGGVGETMCDLNMNLTNSLSYVEFVHLKCDGTCQIMMMVNL